MINRVVVEQNRAQHGLFCFEILRGTRFRISSDETATASTSSTHRASNNLRSADYFRYLHHAQQLHPPSANGCHHTRPQSMHSWLARSPARRAIDCEYRAHRDPEHEAADVRPPRDPAHHCRAPALLQSRIELHREPDEQVDDRRDFDELNENKKSAVSSERARADKKMKYAPSTPAIAPLAPITGTLDSGAIHTVASEAAIPRRNKNQVAQCAHPIFDRRTEDEQVQHIARRATNRRE